MDVSKYDVRNKIMSGRIKTERSSSILYDKKMM